MKEPQFGNIGVCVEGYTKESLYDFLEYHDLAHLLDEQYLKGCKKFNSNMYLQSESLGLYTEHITLNIHGGYVHYVIDMDNFLLILRTGILSPDAANGLVNELYAQGIIKPRSIYG